MCLVPQTYYIEIMICQILRFLFALVMKLHGSYGQILKHRHMRIQIELQELM